MNPFRGGTCAAVFGIDGQVRRLNRATFQHSRTSLLRRIFHRFNDVLIASATAQISFEAMPNLFTRCVRVAVDDLSRSHDHSRGAVAALQTVTLPRSEEHTSE